MSPTFAFAPACSLLSGGWLALGVFLLGRVVLAQPGPAQEPGSPRGFAPGCASPSSPPARRHPWAPGASNTPKPAQVYGPENPQSNSKQPEVLRIKSTVLREETPPLVQPKWE